MMMPKCGNRGVQNLQAVGCAVGVAAVIASSAASLAGQEPVEPESYAVYRLLIPREWPVRVAKAKQIVLKQETVTKPTCFPSGRPLQEEWKPVVDDFRAQNRVPRVLQAGFDVGVPYLLVPAREIEQMFSGSLPGDWRAFYARYPDSGGYTEVSAVGFDPTKTRAMVYVAHGCGGLCGGGTHHFVEKVDGLWRAATIKDLENCQWVS
jgi:hypothetical protein